MHSPIATHCYGNGEWASNRIGTAFATLLPQIWYVTQRGQGLKKESFRRSVWIFTHVPHMSMSSAESGARVLVPVFRSRAGRHGSDRYRVSVTAEITCLERNLRCCAKVPLDDGLVALFKLFRLPGCLFSSPTIASPSALRLLRSVSVCGSVPTANTEAQGKREEPNRGRTGGGGRARVVPCSSCS